MNKEQFDRYLKDRYEDQINWYDRKSVWNQTWYKRLQWGLIVLSSLTPVLIAIDALDDKMVWLAAIPLTTATLVAIFTATIKTFNFQENWLNYRTTCETLRKEKFLYNAGAGAYAGVANREVLFVERVESLISRENTLWLANNTTKQENTDKTSRMNSK